LCALKNKLHSRGDIAANAKRITELREHIHETFAHRSTSREAWIEWERACADFRSQYDSLAFPGGYAAGLRKIQAGDAFAIEDAIAFLELRPYFFRSQYLMTKLTRLLKHVPLSAQQAERFRKVLARPKNRMPNTALVLPRPHISQSRSD
jgi:hypothetical protein